MEDNADKQVVIDAEIAREKRQLANLDAKRAQIQARLDSLNAKRNEMAAAGETDYSSIDDAPIERTPVTPQAKLALFRSLFRGRPDLFALRFVSRRTGNAGYTPACANKFVPGVCGLPRIKCVQCQNQAFQPAGDRAVLAHLQGRHIMGVYPLLDDETCWFLAV